MLTVVFYSVIGVAFSAVYVGGLLILYYKSAELRPYCTEIFATVTNGLIGTVGLVVYGLNIPIAGRVVNMSDLLSRPCTQPDCDKSFARLIAFSVCSTLRFVCWYAEFLVSFCFLIAFRHHPWCAIPLRYAFHTLNVILSGVTFGLSISYTFPTNMIYGSDQFPPVIVQALLFVAAFMSFWFIARSPLFRVRWIVDKRFIVRR